MRVFALSDIHIDFEENRRWLFSLSQLDYKNDILVLAGDITDRVPCLVKAFQALVRCFRKVLYVPGNHDLWVCRDNEKSSFEKFYLIKGIAGDIGVQVESAQFGPLSIVPLFGWYDYSFAQPSADMAQIWADYASCKWPQGFDEASITRHFISMNEGNLGARNQFVISFSHFLPRIDLMPFYVPADKRQLYPVLGTYLLEEQIRRLGSDIHIYGHTHLNRRILKNDTTYINNAFGYPSERRIAAKKLVCVYGS